MIARKLRSIPLNFFVGAFLWLAAGCVTPPPVTTSQVLPENELQLVAAIKKGKDYALGGRPELAEEEFRKAVRLNPKLSSVYNDLGYVLQAQERYDEAALSFLKAIEIEPNNIVARENHARLAFLQGDVERSIKELQQLLETYYSLTPQEIKKATGQDYGPQEITGVYRSLASAYYQAGQYDEAVCFSERTLLTPGKDFSQIGQHARLLLSLGQIPRVRVMLRDFVIVWQQQTPGKLMLDYGIALFSSGDYTLAKEAFSRTLSSKDTDPADRRNAKLFNLLVSVHAQDAAVNQQVQDFLTEDPEFCARKTIDTYGYWPVTVVSEVNSFMGKLCRDEK